jgi:hypothetical protein
LGVISELLRLQKRVDQVQEQEHGAHAGDDVIHGDLQLEALAGPGEIPERGEEQHADGEEQEV